MGLLDGDIKKIAGDALRNIAVDLEVIDPNDGNYNPDSQQFEGGGANQPHKCKGVVDTFSAYERQDPDITIDHRKIIILADTLDIQPKKEFLVKDDQGTVFEITGYDRDPAGATWTINGKK